MLRIKLIFGKSELDATLENTAVARQFCELLPLTLSLEDFATTEKIAYLTEKLDTSSTSPGYAAMKGDIAYYAPWGNLALFYKNGSFAKGLVKLGKIDSGIAQLTGYEKIDVKIALVD
ncbi:MAG: hypothetical protein CL587_20315 [Alteromonadaceae bacterium]|nr:hypothetical protein [Alteromonadaceae bacterium]MBT82725.1 hypothetical protein [Alteromonadaceae bacterium]